MSRKRAEVGRRGGYCSILAKKMGWKYATCIDNKNWSDSEYLTAKEAKEYVNESSHKRDNGEEELKFLARYQKESRG